MNDCNPGSAINVRSQNYLIARATGVCPKCHAETCLVALMLPPQHEVLSIYDGDEHVAEDLSACGDTWDRAPRHALLFYVESLPDPISCRLQALAPTYRIAVSPATQGSHWANHCERCGAFQEDHDLFCEPEGAFLPVSPVAGSRIELVPVREAIEAAAAGYAIDPQFVEFEARP